MLSHRAPLRILLVEDNPGDARLIRELLNEADSFATELAHVDRLAAARVRCADSDIDVVLLDLSLPDGAGLDTVRAALGFAVAPIIVLTGLDDEEVAVQAVHVGAQDYLVKGRLDVTLLVRSIRYARERHELERERQRLLECERQARAEAEAAVRAREDVLGVVSHDIGNMLAAIKIHAHLLNTYLRAADISDDSGPPGVVAARSTADGARVAVKRVEAVWSLVAQMDRLRQDLLDMASLDAGCLSIEPRRHQVRPILTAAIQVVAEPAAAKSLRLVVEVGAAVPDVHADPDRVQQALLNILGNAVKFSPERGRVLLRATGEKEDRVRVSVADTGPGIAAEHLPHVFERFWKLRERNAAGTGLGLAIARGIIEAHGGTIGIESEPGRGTTVSFTLRAAG